MSELLPTVLLVDDEKHSLSAMRLALEDEFECLTADDADAAERLMEEHSVQVIFCDQRMPGRSGVEFLTTVRDRWPDTIRIIVTGYTEVNDMISAINDAGIYQFMAKPWHPDQLMMTAKNAADLFRLSREHDALSLEMRYLSHNIKNGLHERRKALREGLGFEKVLRAPNSPMNLVVAQARQYASFEVPVLICGEAATGKTSMARAMHYGSLRSERPFCEINCVGMNEDTLAIELFGSRGRVSGSGPSNRIGLVRKAERGTLFLNGIGGLSQELQLALLRLVRDGIYYAKGSLEAMHADVRIICGAHSDLRRDVDEGRFLSELLYQLATVQLDMPPLRDRMSDLPVLANELLFDISAQHGKPVRGLSQDALEFLSDYHWPGNLMELKNELTRMLIFSQDPVLGPELISRHILQSSRPQATRQHAPDTLLTCNGSLKERIEEVEARILRESLTRLRWNKSRTANELGLSRVGLRAKIERYGIAPPGSVADRDNEET